MRCYLTKEAQKGPLGLRVCVHGGAIAFFSYSFVILSWIIFHSEHNVLIIILCNFAPPGQVCENCLFVYWLLLFFTRRRVKRTVGSWYDGGQKTWVLGLRWTITTTHQLWDLEEIFTYWGLNNCFRPHLPAHITVHNIPISLFGSKQIYRFSNILTNLKTKIREKQLIYHQ